MMPPMDIVDDPELWHRIVAWDRGAYDFNQACLGYEQLHGQRAANDFRIAAVHGSDAEPAFHTRDAARAASPGGKVNGEANQPCVAPSEGNARIGAISL